MNLISMLLKLIIIMHFSRGPPGEKGDTPPYEPVTGPTETVVGPYGFPGETGEKGDRGLNGRDGAAGEAGITVI